MVSAQSAGRKGPQLGLHVRRGHAQCAVELGLLTAAPESRADVLDHFGLLVLAGVDDMSRVANPEPDEDRSSRPFVGGRPLHRSA